MRDTEAMNIFTGLGAYQRGHFRLSSGLHSGGYLQCALVLANPKLAARLCGALAEKYHGPVPDVVIGPAMGGIVLAYELARIFNARAFFAERNAKGEMALKRGFFVTPANKVLIAEDVLTTGQSVNEVISLLRKDGVNPVGIACLADRSGGRVKFGGIKCASLIKLDIPTFTEKECPLCQEGLPLVKPGSRK